MVLGPHALASGVCDGAYPDSPALRGRRADFCPADGQRRHRLSAVAELAKGRGASEEAAADSGEGAAGRAVDSEGRERAGAGGRREAEARRSGPRRRLCAARGTFGGRFGPDRRVPAAGASHGRRGLFGLHRQTRRRHGRRGEDGCPHIFWENRFSGADRPAEIKAAGTDVRHREIHDGSGRRGFGSSLRLRDFPASGYFFDSVPDYGVFNRRGPRRTAGRDDHRAGRRGARPL